MCFAFSVNFGGELSHFGKAQIQIITDGSDPNTATIVVNYLTAIISSYQQQIKPAPPVILSNYSPGTGNYIM